MQNPNTAQVPQYAAEEFKEERKVLIDAGLNPQKAVELLKGLWNVKNKRDRALWKHGQQVTAGADEDKAPHTPPRLPLERELLDVFKEEWESRKAARLGPIEFSSRGPSLELIKPSHPPLVARCKLKAFQFCELWFFTNDSYDEAERTQAHVDDDDCLSVVRWHDDSLVLLPAAFFRGKSGLVQDSDLSWEQFAQATCRMAKEMAHCGWQKPHIDMYVKFWTNIANHKWRHSRIESRQRALLDYQQNQRRSWHMKRGAFDLTIIDDKVLEQTYHRMEHVAHSKQMELLLETLHPDFEDEPADTEPLHSHSRSSGYKRSPSPPRGPSKRHRHRRRSSHYRREY